jgi:hypothetical protein
VLLHQAHSQHLLLLLLLLHWALQVLELLLVQVRLAQLWAGLAAVEPARQQMMLASWLLLQLQQRRWWPLLAGHCWLVASHERPLLLLPLMVCLQQLQASLLQLLQQQQLQLRLARPLVQPWRLLLPQPAAASAAAAAAAGRRAAAAGARH